MKLRIRRVPKCLCAVKNLLNRSAVAKGARPGPRRRDGSAPYEKPYATIASATFLKPAMLAPLI